MHHTFLDIHLVPPIYFRYLAAHEWSRKYNFHIVSEHLMEDEYNHVSEELVYCLTNVPGPGLVGGIPADLGGCLCTVGWRIEYSLRADTLLHTGCP